VLPLLVHRNTEQPQAPRASAAYAARHAPRTHDDAWWHIARTTARRGATHTLHQVRVLH
jgi:hypothetical protein